MTSEQAPKRGPYWHAYGREVLPNMYGTVIAGPSQSGPDDLNEKGILVRDALPEWTYLGNFDHEPTDFEKDQIQPENYRHLDDLGNEIPWEEGT